MRILNSEIIDKVGEEVHLAGWVNTRRDHGKLIFIDLRDRSGISQLVFIPQNFSGDTFKIAESLRSEWVLQIKGRVKQRPKGMENKDMGEMGKYEIEVLEITAHNESKTPPFDIGTDGYEVNEEVRMKYRYLDLRRDRLARNMKIRSAFIDRARQFLFQKGFLEIETPLLTKSTPDGSRDFVVPSRLHPGKFFALPQSPQQYKQLLMVAGFERYFQIARCVRDEDLRADRGFEHTQIDIEMSFVEQKDVMQLDEEMITSVVEDMGYAVKQKPFPILTYKKAMEKHGADKFDMRNEKDKKDGALAFAWVVDFPFFEKDKKGSWTFTHNPFSMPKFEHIEWLRKSTHIDEILTTQYDLVCNGVEVGGGSIRAHTSEILRAVFSVMGYADKVIEEQFGHMLEAFGYGAPPHGGIAHGVERLLMTLLGEEYLREVQAFPQTSSGRTSVMDAPSELSKEQLKELHIKIENR